MAETGYRNPETKDPTDKSQRSKGQTKNFRKKRHKSKLYNNNNGLKKELV